MQESVYKVMRMAGVAKQNGWHGTLESDVVNGCKVTELQAARNDETITVIYRDGAMTRSEYTIFGAVTSIYCPKTAIEKLSGWPDLLKLFKQFPNMNRPTLVETYRRLPFSFDEPNEEIMAKMIGRTVTWYSHTSTRIDSDTVLPPRKHTKKENFRIVDIGHRKLFHFIGTQIGFRSILLDTLLKVK